MPELPEVELAAKALNKAVALKKITQARLIREKLAPDSPPALFEAGLKDAEINFVGRRGKHILFDLGNGNTLMVHLRMTGRFLLLDPDDELPKHTHAVFYLSNEARLVFQDQRHFGFMKVEATSGLQNCKELKDLAPEPFSEAFSDNYFFSALEASKRKIKEFLLDQSKVCGLGNIYAAESLFMAGIAPLKAANSISRKKASLLREKIIEVLAESISHGSTLNIGLENIEAGYYGGGYEGHWRVYDREGQPCPRCEALIKRIVQGGRSSYFCPKCQRR